MVDTSVSTLNANPLLQGDMHASLQTQATLRSTGATSMKEADYNKFVKAHADGKLIKAADAGYVIAALSVRDPNLLGDAL